MKPAFASGHEKQYLVLITVFEDVGLNGVILYELEYL